ncbi:MAG: glycosyltransferase family 39 protein [Chloroflexi bacterium]|nr:glycosyltransferase family 39 protein [Chloroflexota bacterium]
MGVGRMPLDASLQQVSGPLQRRSGLCFFLEGPRLHATMAVLALVAFALRVHGLGVQSIWYDEGYSLHLAQQSLSDIWTNVIADHVPLYFWLLHLWIQVVGSGEFAARYFSLLLGVLAVPLSYKTTGRLLGPRVALLAALLSAVSPFYVYYSQETRMYTMVLVLALLAVYAYCGMGRGRQGSWILYVLSVAALGYTHYYGLLLPLFLNVAWLTSMAGSLWQRWRSIWLPDRIKAGYWGAAQLAALALYLPWAWRSAHLFNDFQSASWQALTPAKIFWDSAIAFGLGHSIERLNASPTDSGYGGEHLQAQLLAMALVAIWLFGLLWRSERVQRATITTALWLVVPGVAFYALSWGKRDFTARYLMVSAPAYYTLLAAGMLNLRRISRLLVVSAVALVLATTGYSLWHYYFDVKYWRDDHRAAVAYVQAHAQPNEAIILDAAYFYPAFDYYYRGGAPHLGLPEQYPPDEAKTAAKLQDLLRRYDYLWLVLWQDYYSDPARFVETYLDRNAVRAREATFLGNIQVRGYRTRLPILTTEPIGMVPVGQRLGDAVELAGYRLGKDRARGGSELTFSLYWRLLQKVVADYTVFVHLVNPAGQILAQADGPPVYGRLGTTRWPVGVLIEDEHVVSVPSFTPAGEYALVVGLYDPRSMRRLGEGGADRVRLAPVELAPEAATNSAVPNPVGVALGDLVKLAGYEVAGQANPGGGLRVDLFWEARGTVSDDLTVFLHLADDKGLPLAQDDAKPGRGSYPTNTWLPGMIVRDQHNLALPVDLPQGKYHLAVGLYDAASGRRLSFRPWPWSKEETRVVLKDIVVQR